MKKKKNILFVLPDQMRWDYLGCYGAEFAITPNIDKLAKEGVKYTNCISPSPLCVPARASMLTGKNAIENGVLDNRNWLRPDHEECGSKSWPRLVSSNGYETVAVGKMHFYPWDIMEGFDKRIISEDKRHVSIKDDYAEFLEEHNLHKYAGADYKEYIEQKGAMKNPFPREYQADYWIAEQACGYLEERKEQDKPFCMMVGFVSPHCPYDPDEKFLKNFDVDKIPNPIPVTESSSTFREKFVNVYKADWAKIDCTEFTTEQKKKIKAHYLACIQDVDECLGRIVECLKEKGLYDDTIIIFASDHGDLVGDFGLMGKHYFYDPSIHVPLVIHDPDIESQGKTYEDLVSLTDIRATILHIAGVDEETNESKVLSCYKEETEERTICGATDIGWMLRRGRWKYTFYFNQLEELYDLENDPYEQNNLSGNENYKEVEETCRKNLQIWVMKSIVSANTEKIADIDSAKCKDDFDHRNWKRKYPYS